MPGNHNHYGTVSEMRYLDGLGTYCQATRRTREQLLRAYISNAPVLRKRMVNINMDKVLAHAERLLAWEVAGGKVRER